MKPLFYCCCCGFLSTYAGAFKYIEGAMVCESCVTPDMFQHHSTRVGDALCAPGPCELEEPKGGGL